MRMHDWQSRLDRVVCGRLRASFVWGRLDCCLFAADCVEAVTGTDPAADIRGTYVNELGAARLVQRLGGLAAIAAARLGDEIAPTLGQPGDVGLADCGGRDTLVVCIGMHWHGPGERGLLPIAADRVVRAWRCC